MIVLGSSSPYRRQLLNRLGVPFCHRSPAIDETPAPGESPEATAQRLAEEKARVVAEEFPAHLIIGADQVACLRTSLIGKPLTHDRATAQLHAFSGQEVLFHTAVAVLDSARSEIRSTVIDTYIRFRQLTAAEIDSYLSLEKPYDCAGSFKAEGLGIALFERLASEDPTAIIGLPMIALNHLLLHFGYNALVNDRAPND